MCICCSGDEGSEDEDEEDYEEDAEVQTKISSHIFYL